MRVTICHSHCLSCLMSIFFFQAEDGIRDVAVTGVQTCALPILPNEIQSDALGRHTPMRTGPLLAEAGKVAQARYRQLVECTAVAGRAEQAHSHRRAE